MWRRIVAKLSGSSAKTSGWDKKILVIEDNPVDRRVITGSLEKEGFKITIAITGKEGLAILQNDPPDLIFLDCNLPDIEGKDICKAIKLNEKTARIPVIFLTGQNTPQNIIDCYEVGAEYYLSKPISAKMLLKQVKLTLQDQESRS